MKKPNIIIFNPDQWRSDVIGCHGNPAAVTPFIDNLVANEAVSFNNAFCQNPVCTPSRCSFMTGWYPHVRGHRTMNYMLHPEHDEPNLLKILKDNGYTVWWGGKNDLVPRQDGFEEYCDIKFSPDENALAKRGLTLRRNLHHTVKEWAAKLEDGNAFSFYAGLLDKGEDEFYCDGDWAMVLGAIDFIHNYDGDKPLCIYLPLENPHPPYGIEEPYFSMIDREKIPSRIPVPKNNCAKPMILNGIRTGQKLQNWTESQWSELRAVYYGMCARLDEQFKVLTDALKQTGKYDSSAIFLFSDHGDFTGDYGLVEKTQNTFEDCLTKVPFIIKPPVGKTLIPGVNNALIELVDFSATIYKLAGIEPGYDHFGKSLLSLLSGEASELRQAVFCEGGKLLNEKQAHENNIPDDSIYRPRLTLMNSNEKPWNGKAVMCRTKEYKYVARYYERDEFYDLTSDPGEQVNQIDNQAYAEAITAHKQLMLDWFIKSCDVVPYQMDSR